MAIMGPSKSGKTYTALEIATELVGPDGKIAFVDTEHGSASKYSGPGGFKFDVDENVCRSGLAAKPGQAARLNIDVPA